MYYVITAVLLIILYFALTKLLSSLLKGCLVTVGIFILLFLAVVFLKSAKEEVILFEKIKVDNFKVTVLDGEPVFKMEEIIP